MEKGRIGLVAGIVVTILAIPVSFAALSGSLAEKSIIERLAPEGTVTVETGGKVITQAAAVVTDIGQKRYEETCHICHGPGLAGSPKFGDKTEWAPRIAEGIETLVKHAIQGYKAMPPKGTCMACSDEEIHKAVEYMVSHSK